MRVLCPTCDETYEAGGPMGRHQEKCPEPPSSGAIRKRRQRERERTVEPLAAPTFGWQERGACRDMDTDWWFPAEEQSTRNTPLTADNRAAIAICWEACPVRESCLAFAVALGPSTHGIFGGLTPGQRRRRRSWAS